jgi:hypothetical protein
VTIRPSHAPPQEREPRLVAYLAALFSIYITLDLALGSLKLLVPSVVTEGLSELCIYLMFFALLAAVSRGGPFWLIAQVVSWLIWTIILTAGDPSYQHGTGEDTGYLPGKPAWEHALFYVYWAINALIRAGALFACESRLAHTPRSRWVFRVLILTHVGMFLSALAVLHVDYVSGIDSATLLNEMVVIIVYCVTPLMLVHFMILQQSTSRWVVLWRPSIRTLQASRLSARLCSPFLRPLTRRH